MRWIGLPRTGMQRIGMQRIGFLRPSRVFLTAFAVFFGLSACWSLATPMFASPDETSHLVKAAATVRGEISGTKGFVLEFGIEQPMRTYRVPSAYGETVFPCFAFDNRVTPACDKKVPQDQRLLAGHGSISMWTTAGHYNPVYYALVGWPSLMFKGVGGMYLMRLVSALINSLLLAGAAALAAAWRRPAFILAGLVAAATPMVLFLNSVVNPNGIEASSAVLAWIAALSLALQPDEGRRRTRVIAFVAAAAVLVNVRPLGYEWLAAILAVSVLVARKGAVKAALRHRTTWRSLAVALPAFLFGLWWTLGNGDNAEPPPVLRLAFVPAAHATLNGTQWGLYCMIGLFDWVHTPAPMVTYDLWIGVVITLALVACALGRVRQCAAVLAMAVGVVFIPVVAQGVEAKHIGMAWQGRYLLAFAVGLPILAGAVLAARVQEAGLPRWADHRIALTFSAVLAFADFAAFFRALRRSMVGLNGKLLLEPIKWQPPGTWLLWVPLYALLLGAFVAFVGRVSRPSPTAALPNQSAAPVLGLVRLRRP